MANKKAVRPIPANLVNHVSDYLELTSGWLGGDGCGCETVARFPLAKGRLIVSREHMLDAIEEAFLAGKSQSASDMMVTREEMMAEVDAAFLAGKTAGVADILATIDMLSNDEVKNG